MEKHFLEGAEQAMVGNAQEDGQLVEQETPSHPLRSPLPDAGRESAALRRSGRRCDGGIVTTTAHVC